ncbi:MAG TPA: hypothetical protein DEA96_12545 [Leptospiraceae bacterium]|nr:hypothetical protein [Spirochaetaceae bacterium]HBS05791.1 hypothetical protein [Leptospiraceae bacterium]|tara:strand:+ start:20842 stop:21450 length:609 start_codon:yes stop_codon:yes gene_type:complete
MEPKKSQTGAGIRRWLLWISALTILLIMGIVAYRMIVPALLTLGPPHTFSHPAAQLSPDLLASWQKEAKDSGIGDRDELVEFVLRRTAGILHPDFNHTYSLEFKTPRPAHCLEYSHLFGTTFNHLARKLGIEYRAMVVRSNTARFAGQKIPLPGFDNHDWILVVPLVNYVLSSQAFSSDSLYLDPMLYDVFFVSDVEASVIP